MMVPTIHLNGTSRESLIEDLEKASQAIDDAYSALKRCCPNGRDFYPQGSECIHVAVREHMARLKKLDEVKEELDALISAIAKQGK